MPINWRKEPWNLVEVESPSSVPSTNPAGYRSRVLGAGSPLAIAGMESVLANSWCWACLPETTVFQPPQTCRKKPVPPHVQNVVWALTHPFSLFLHVSPLSIICGFSLTFYIKLVCLLLLLLLLAFCFLNKPKSKTKTNKIDLLDQE